MLKPMLGLAGRVLFKAKCQEGPINPHLVREEHWKKLASLWSQATPLRCSTHLFFNCLKKSYRRTRISAGPPGYNRALLGDKQCKLVPTPTWRWQTRTSTQVIPLTSSAKSEPYTQQHSPLASVNLSVFFRYSILTAIFFSPRNATMCRVCLYIPESRGTPMPTTQANIAKNAAELLFRNFDAMQNGLFSIT